MAGLNSTHISQVVINLFEHLGYSPLHDIAEMSIVDVVVLPPDSSLSTLLQLILPIAEHSSLNLVCHWAN
jgi:hypothetical protein